MTRSLAVPPAPTAFPDSRHALSAPATLSAARGLVETTNGGMLGRKPGGIGRIPR